MLRKIHSEVSKDPRKRDQVHLDKNRLSLDLFITCREFKVELYQFICNILYNNPAVPDCSVVETITSVAPSIYGANHIIANGGDI